MMALSDVITATFILARIVRINIVTASLAGILHVTKEFSIFLLVAAVATPWSWQILEQSARLVL